MGFFDEYVDDSPGSVYLNGDEKDALIENGTVFTITGVVFEPEQGYDDNDRYVATVAGLGEGDEERKLSFQAGGVDSRDRMLASMQEFIARTGEGVNVKLTKQGRSVLITAA
jgi:hypothetical protein